MIKYKASVISKKITAVEVVRETEKFVVFSHSKGEFKEAKASEYTAYFDSFEDAKSWIVEQYELQVGRFESMLKSYKNGLEFVLSLEPPSDD